MTLHLPFVTLSSQGWAHSSQEYKLSYSEYELSYSELTPVYSELTPVYSELTRVNGDNTKLASQFGMLLWVWDALMRKTSYKGGHRTWGENTELEVTCWRRWLRWTTWFKLALSRRQKCRPKLGPLQAYLSADCMCTSTKAKLIGSLPAGSRPPYGLLCSRQLLQLLAVQRWHYSAEQQQLLYGKGAGRFYLRCTWAIRFQF